MDKYINLLKGIKDIRSQVQLIDKKASIYLCICLCILIFSVKKFNYSNHIVNYMTIINVCLIIYIIYLLIMKIAIPRAGSMMNSDEHLIKILHEDTLVLEQKIKYLRRASKFLFISMIILILTTFLPLCKSIIRHF